MKKKDRKILKEVFSEVSKLTYSELKSRFKKEFEEKLKIDTKYCSDLNIEGRLEREEYITNLDIGQLNSFKSVVKSIQDNYLFTENDIDRLNNFTSRINYLLKSTSPHNRGMADQMNNIKHGAIINPNAPTFTLKSDSDHPKYGNSKSTELEIHEFFNDCIKSSTWSEFKSYSELDSSFFDKSFEWKLVYVFSNIKNCQDKNNYPLYYAAWQVTAEWCFDIEYGSYDAFCNYYKYIDFLDEPKLIHFNCYFYLLRLALRNDVNYQNLLNSKEEKEKQSIIKELRENEDDDPNIKKEINIKKNMVSINKFFVVAINQLSRIFSTARAGKEFDFTLSTSESSLSDSTISQDDFLLVSVDDSVYYQFKVIAKTEEIIKLKKIFEIEKSIGYTIDKEGSFQETTQQEFDTIRSKLFSDFNTNDNSINENTDLSNLQEGFVNWFLAQPNQSYFEKKFGGNKERLIEHLTKYEDIYKDQFNKDVFQIADGELEPHIKDLETNLYLKSGDFFTFSKNTSNDMPRAILGKPNYLKYLKELLASKETLVASIIQPQIDFNLGDFEKACVIAGLKYTSKLITRYISSLATKPFVLLSGLSGSGKTKLAEAFAKWICESDKQYALIPVGADWTNREPLLGYPNALKDNEYVKPDNDALDLLLRAKKDEKRPYFLILDEMNLSHVERYFADFLSTMESKNSIPLHKMEEEINKIPKKIKLPKNLFIVGTVNIDETTYMFSPKVLDRANTIEFRVSDINISNFLKNPKDIELKKLKGKGAIMATNFVERATATKNGVKIEENYKLAVNQKVINNFFEELQKSGAEFGYRTAFEISKLIYKLKEFGLTDENDKLDIAIMQKMLPKLHGSRTKLTRTLKPLAKLCLDDVNENFDKEYFENFDKIKFKEDENIKYKLSFEKIMRMYKNAVENGFASYAEA